MAEGGSLTVPALNHVNTHKHALATREIGEGQLFRLYGDMLVCIT